MFVDKVLFDFLDFMLPYIIAFSGIIGIYIAYILRKRENITDVDSESFSLYKDIYFSGISDSYGSSLDYEVSHDYFSSLYFLILWDENKSLLLSKECLTVLRTFHQLPTPSNLYLLIERIRIDFRGLKAKLGYYKAKRIEIAKWYFFLLVALLTLIFLLSLSGAIIFIVSKGDADKINIATTLWFFAVPLVLLFCSSVYVFRYKYIML